MLHAIPTNPIAPTTNLRPDMARLARLGAQILADRGLECDRNGENDMQALQVGIAVNKIEMADGSVDGLTVDQIRAAVQTPVSLKSRDELASERLAQVRVQIIEQTGFTAEWLGDLGHDGLAAIVRAVEIASECKIDHVKWPTQYSAVEVVTDVVFQLDELRRVREDNGHTIESPEQIERRAEAALAMAEAVEQNDGIDMAQAFLAAAITEQTGIQPAELMLEIAETDETAQSLIAEICGELSAAPATATTIEIDLADNDERDTVDELVDDEEVFYLLEADSSREDVPETPAKPTFKQRKPPSKGVRRAIATAKSVGDWIKVQRLGGKVPEGAIEAQRAREAAKTSKL